MDNHQSPAARHSSLRPSRTAFSAAIALWVVLAAGRALSSSGSGATRAGVLVGELLVSLVLALIGRFLVRLVRRQPVLAPFWTPALFFVAAALIAVTVIAAAGHGSS